MVGTEKERGEVGRVKPNCAWTTQVGRLGHQPQKNQGSFPAVRQFFGGVGKNCRGVEHVWVPKHGKRKKGERQGVAVVGGFFWRKTKGPQARTGTGKSHRKGQQIQSKGIGP